MYFTQLDYVLTRWNESESAVQTRRFLNIRSHWMIVKIPNTFSGVISKQRHLALTFLVRWLVALFLDWSADQIFSVRFRIRFHSMWTVLKTIVLWRHHRYRCVEAGYGRNTSIHRYTQPYSSTYSPREQSQSTTRNLLYCCTTNVSVL